MASSATPSHSLLGQPVSRSRRQADSIISSQVPALKGPHSCASERQTQPSVVPAWAPAAELALRNSHLRRCGYVSRRGAGASRRRTTRASVATGTGAGETEGQPSAPLLTRVADFQHAFWKFLRPHTIRGTVLGTTYAPSPHNAGLIPHLPHVPGLVQEGILARLAATVSRLQLSSPSLSSFS